MPFLTIPYGKSWTTPGARGDARILREGVHEFTEEALAAIENDMPRWVRVTMSKPKVAAAANPARPLTKDDIELGTELADEKARADALAKALEEADKADQPEDPAGEVENPNPFACEVEECEETFPTDAARERHVEMNHAEPAEPADEAPAKPKTRRTAAQDKE